MVKLINTYAQKGEMLGRPMIELYESIRTFFVAEEEGKVIGLGALAVIWNDMAEMRTLAVHADYHGNGIGRQIVDALIEDAIILEVPRVFCLTYQPGFFKKMGFVDIEKSELPHKVWKDCINCPKFPDCDENALILDLHKEPRFA
jgi:amino-acid N-acetyltransferase